MPDESGPGRKKRDPGAWAKVADEELAQRQKEDRERLEAETRGQAEPRGDHPGGSGTQREQERGETEREPVSGTSAPGWYANPDGSGLRYWDRGGWTDSYHPGQDPTLTASHKQVLWGLSLGFGSAGGITGLLEMPVIAFYWPLGLGVAGVALAIAAATTKGGETPWYAAIAVIGSLAALGLGIDAYSQFQDASGSAAEAQQQLEDILGP